MTENSKVEVASHEKTRQAMQYVLDKLNVPLNVAWVPDPNRDKHGEIELNSGMLFVYDLDPQQAWETFQHELLEWKLKQASKIYRTIINSLIEALETLVYQNKEQFLDSIPQILKTVEEAKASLK